MPPIKCAEFILFLSWDPQRGLPQLQSFQTQSKKKKKKGSRGGRGTHQEIAVTVVRSLEWANMMGRCSVKERRLVYEKKKKKKKKKKEEEEEEEIWTSN